MFASLLMIFALTTPAFAADGEATTPPQTLAQRTPLASDVDRSLWPVRPDVASRGAALPVLYVSLGALNAFDAFSTTRALSAGIGSEANPLIGKVGGDTAAMWAMKGAATAGMIFAAERLWRHHKRGQAVALMLVSNGVMAAVTAQNARVLLSR